MGNPVNTHWCSLFKKGPRVEGSSLTNPKKASVVWLFRQVQIGILASQTVSLTPPPVESSFRKVCHLHLTFRRYTLLIWERQMRGKKTSGVWFLMTLLFFQNAPASAHHGLPSLPPSWKVLLSPLPSSSSSSSSSSVYKTGPSESESLAWYSLWPSSSEALKDSEDSPVSPGVRSWGAAFPSSSLVVKLWKAQTWGWCEAQSNPRGWCQHMRQSSSFISILGAVKGESNQPAKVTETAQQYCIP